MTLHPNCTGTEDDTLRKAFGGARRASTAWPELVAWGGIDFMNAALCAEGLSKRYRIGARRMGEYRTLRESMVSALAAPVNLWRWMRRTGHSERDHLFWALKDVSFSVQPGEIFGIIGRNGAGKSTLLKVLSRITEPTVGNARIRGRLGSLLEVGTGFHHELTGRENIYLSGAILGMTRQEITRKFDQIVDFAEVGAFLDTPVKRYSSGMYVRLAFAVVAHLEPEILLVDEVLAVGDAPYQRRCIDRMAELTRSGRTVLFVSHNLEVVPRICGRAMLLDRGAVAAIGPAEAITQQYFQALAANASGHDLSSCFRHGDGRARFARVQLVDSSGRVRGAHKSGDDLIVRLEIVADHDLPDAALSVSLKTPSDTRLISSWTREHAFRVDIRKGMQVFECRFRQVAIRPSHKVVPTLWMESRGTVDFVPDAKLIEVVDGAATVGLSTDAEQGIILVDSEWRQVAGASPRVLDDDAINRPLVARATAEVRTLGSARTGHLVR